MRARLTLWLVTLAVVFSSAARAAEPMRLLFQPHGAFFSLEFHQQTLIDPQVFCAEPSSPSAVGLQGIRHRAGLRNARLSDPIDKPIFAADGKRLPFTLGQWLDAAGTAEIAEVSQGSQITMRFARLVPDGRYSLFENHFDTQPPSFTPLDGTGKGNSFIADGNGDAQISVLTPGRLGHDNGILVVYHSDGITHGIERGPLGVTAHHQLVLRVPER
ncbi:MAG: hypothetical protein NVS2B17_19620 [Candidatus Velthaea sp.]